MKERSQYTIMEDNIKVLIVDDEPDICYFLSRNLSRRNYKVNYVHTLEAAETQLQQEKPTIVLLDNHLPDGFGINFSSKIKSIYPDIKIVMVTAHDSPQDRSKAYENGVNFFLSKPFTVTEINKAIDNVLEEETE